MTTKKKGKIKQIQVKRVEQQNIFEYNKSIVMIYNKNVNLARAVPHIFDGLKVVERRILFAMFQDHKMKPGKEKKVSELIGTVIGKYHPHGETSPGGTLVKLGQYWSFYPTLIGAEGNFGSIFGDRPAAMRYISARMEEFTYDAYFSEWHEGNSTDFNPNYTGEYVEPEYLPAKYPMIFIKGTFGIGSGLSTGIPSFNLNELIDLVLKLIDNPDYKKCWLVPDMPDRCLIVDNDFKKMCEIGEGAFRTRGEMHVDKNGDLIITSLPYNVTADKVMAKIIEIVKEKKLDGISGVVDDSDKPDPKDTESRPTLRIHISIKQGFNAEIIKEALYRMTPMESSFTVRFEATYDYQNYRYSMRSALLDWLELRRETKRRIYSNEYSRLSKRYHLLESLIGIMQNGGDTKLLKIVKSSRNRSTIVEKLISAFGVTDIQAEAIADMKMYQLSKENTASFKEEKKTLEGKLKAVYDKLADDDIVDEEIKEELKECKKKYGRKRVCDVIDVSEEGKVPNTNHTIIITKHGLIKKLSGDMDGVGFIEQQDKATQIMKLNNRESLLFFDKSGKVYSIPVSDIPETAVDEAGVALSGIVNTGSSRIVSILKKYEDCDKTDEKGPYYVFVTDNGMIKRSHCANYSKVTKGGLAGIVLKKTDSLQSVIEVKGNKDIVIFTKGGKGIRYNTKEIPATLRMSSGVIGIRMTEEEMYTQGVAGLTQIKRGDKYLFMLTNKGNGKKCQLMTFTDMKRGDASAQLSDLREGEFLIGVKPVKEEDVIDVFTSEKTEQIAISDVPELTRRAKMKKLIGVRKGENIIDID